jgi:hypothetical protein
VSAVRAAVAGLLPVLRSLGCCPGESVDVQGRAFGDRPDGGGHGGYAGMPSWRAMIAACDSGPPVVDTLAGLRKSALMAAGPIFPQTRTAPSARAGVMAVIVADMDDGAGGLSGRAGDACRRSGPGVG